MPERFEIKHKIPTRPDVYRLMLVSRLYGWSGRILLYTLGLVTATVPVAVAATIAARDSSFLVRMLPYWGAVGVCILLYLLVLEMLYRSTRAQMARFEGPVTASIDRRGLHLLYLGRSWEILDVFARKDGVFVRARSSSAGERMQTAALFAKDGDFVSGTCKALCKFAQSQEGWRYCPKPKSSFLARYVRFTVALLVLFAIAVAAGVLMLPA